MLIGRRDMLLAGLGLGVALAAGTRAFAARGPFSTYGVLPGGGAIDQRASLQAALDEAARTGVPFFLPPGIYATGRLELKSRMHLKGVPGKSILRCRQGGALLSIENATDIRIEGVVLDGDGRPLGDDGALLAATDAEQLDIKDCRIVKASANGVVLRRVSGRIANCDIGDIRRVALCSDDARGLEIADNHIHDCGDNGILVYAELASAGVIIANNVVNRAATGIAVTNRNEGGRLAIVRGNLVRNLFFRKHADPRGDGIAIDADADVSGNVVENAPGFGVVVGGLRDVTVTANLIRNANIGIGVSAGSEAGRALVADNFVSGAKDGAVRAMEGLKPVGPDLVHAGADAFRNLEVYANVAR